MLLILIVLFTILAGAGKGKFLNFDNLIEVVRDASIPTIRGVGVTYIIITAGIDL
jgi:ribose/xylose/arabinose/galactoside ABC-type transport system permease subunit